ncbi:MAG: hypothetical protein QM501_01385 [Gimesia sp.]
MTSEPTNKSVSSDEMALLMPDDSKYAGQLIDISSRRSIQIDSEQIGDRCNSFDDNATISPDASHVIVDYFYHREQFWRARIPLDGVDQVYGQCFNFSQIKMKQGKDGLEKVYNKSGFPKRKYKILNHLQSRFKLKADSPIELFSMEDQNCNSPLFEIFDFVYSLETVGPIGVVYNVVDGLRGHLIAAHRMFSTEEMVFERIVVQNEYVIETLIPKLNTLQKRELLVKSMMRSHTAGMSEKYYLLRLCKTNNCTSSPFQILDSVAHYSIIQRLGTGLYRFPLSPMFYLRIRGLVSTSSKQMLVRDEFEEYIQNPETRKRKSNYLKRKSRAKREARINVNTE